MENIAWTNNPVGLFQKQSEWGGKQLTPFLTLFVRSQTYCRRMFVSRQICAINWASMVVTKKTRFNLSRVDTAFKIKTRECWNEKRTLGFQRCGMRRYRWRRIVHKQFLTSIVSGFWMDVVGLMLGFACQASSEYGERALASCRRCSPFIAHGIVVGQIFSAETFKIRYLCWQLKTWIIPDIKNSLISWSV